MHLCSQEVNTNPKSRFCYDLLTTTHEVDLVRVYPHDKIMSNSKETAKRLEWLVEDSQAYTKKLYDYAKILCEATGCYRVVDNHPGNDKLFAKCSTSGKFCWQKVQNAPLPKWNDLSE
jgi:hypothetical protein